MWATNIKLKNNYSQLHNQVWEPLMFIVVKEAKNSIPTFQRKVIQKWVWLEPTIGIILMFPKCSNSVRNYDSLKGKEVKVHFAWQRSDFCRQMRLLWLTVPRLPLSGWVLRGQERFQIVFTAEGTPLGPFVRVIKIVLLWLQLYFLTSFLYTLAIGY